MSDEVHLIAQAKAGSADAFAGLVLLYQGRVRVFLRRFVHHEDVADDIAQEVFLNAFRALPDYRPDAPFGAWLLAIARNQALAHLRGEGRRRAREAGLVEATLLRWHEELLDAPAWSPSSQDRRISALAECVERLPARSATVVNRFYFHGDKAVEIAADMGKDVPALRKTLQRIRQALRQCVRERLAMEAR